MLNSPKALANRLNAQLSTGPKTSRGKRISSKNSIKHGLNVEIDFESSDAYTSLKSLLAEEGRSPLETADITSKLLNYRRMMDAYYEAYTQPEEVRESIWDMDLSTIHMGVRGLPAGVTLTTTELRSIGRLLGRFQRKERRRGGPVSRRTVDCHKLIRYQRHSISRLSKAIRSE